MLTLELARRLTAAGLTWTPAAGDRFVVPVADMEQEVFVISDLTVDVHHFETGDVIGFNGTTEWALDSVEQSKVVWLPREDQLRTLLGGAFVALEAVGAGEGFTAVVRLADGNLHRSSDIDPERAYARALLALVEDGVVVLDPATD